MAAFDSLDWSRFDVHAIVSFAGLATIEDERLASYLAWLSRHDYQTSTLDFRSGLNVAIPALGKMLNWEQQFGYQLGPDSRNVNALRDGFEIDWIGQGAVLVLLRPDLAWKEDAAWTSGLLSIASEKSREALALGRRFFSLLVMPKNSPLIGVSVAETKVPGFFWDPGPASNDSN